VKNITQIGNKNSREPTTKNTLNKSGFQQQVKLSEKA